MSKIGRNDPCPCGSGRKYKKCHPGAYDSAGILPDSLAEMPVISCAVNDDFQESGLATVVVVRENLDNQGKFVIATFLCDIFCLGVKDVALYPNATVSTLENFLNRMPQDFGDIAYEDARDLVLGAVEYALRLGLEPYREFKDAQMLIEADQPYNAKKFVYGKNGRPMYVTGPHDDYDKIFTSLETSCGKGNFDYVIDSRTKYIYPKS